MQKEDLSLAKLCELLVTTKTAEGKSEQSNDWYKQAIGAYALWLQEQGQEPILSNFTLEHVRAYIVALQKRPVFEHHPTAKQQERHLSDYSINSYARALRAFSNWLYNEQYTVEKILPSNRFQVPKVTKKIQDILTQVEIVRIVSALNPRTETGARDQAIFLLLLDTGMRASELCGLKLEDLHLEDGYATVLARAKKSVPSR